MYAFSVGNQPPSVTHIVGPVRWESFMIRDVSRKIPASGRKSKPEHLGEFTVADAAAFVTFEFLFWLVATDAKKSDGGMSGCNLVVDARVRDNSLHAGAGEMVMLHFAFSDPSRPGARRRLDDKLLMAHEMASSKEYQTCLFVDLDDRRSISLDGCSGKMIMVTIGGEVHRWMRG